MYKRARARTQAHKLKLAAPRTKAASSLFHRAGLALLACGNASRGNENTGKSLQLFLEREMGPAVARSHACIGTYAATRTHARQARM